MTGSLKTQKSVAIKSAQNKATGRNGGGNAKVSAQTIPGSKGVMVGKNAGKGVVQSSAPKLAMTKINTGGSIKGKKC